MEYIIGITVYYILVNHYSNIEPMIFTTIQPIIIIVSLVSFIYASQMKIDIHSSTFTMSVFWVKAKVAMRGGMPPYIYQYSSIPSGWKQVN